MSIVFLVLAFTAFFLFARNWFRSRDIQSILETFPSDSWLDSFSISASLYPHHQVIEPESVRRLLALMERQGLVEHRTRNGFLEYRITSYGLKKRDVQILTEKEA